jgi:uncharacterized protein (TIGR02145 family)
MLALIILSSCDLDILNIEKDVKPDEEIPADDGTIISINSVVIGDQTWMSKNLNIGNMINENQASANNNVIEKHCYNNDTAMCSIYGGLYTWNEIMRYQIQEGSQGICPTGWHVPSLTDWQILLQHLGGNPSSGGKLKEPGTEHWNSPNLTLDEITEFLALPSGVYIPNRSRAFQNLNNATYFWTSTGNTDFSWSVLLLNSDTAATILSNPVRSGLPIRCIKD